MITLFASIAGFITSIIPELIKIMRDKHNKAHELEILDRQIKFSNKNYNKEIEEVKVIRDVAVNSALYSTYNTGISWVDALNGSVRPVLAYSFFGLYSFVKIMQYFAIKNSSHILDYIELLWNINDEAIFAGIISFYFGQRTFKKFS